MEAKPGLSFCADRKTLKFKKRTRKQTGFNFRRVGGKSEITSKLRFILSWSFKGQCVCPVIPLKKLFLTYGVDHLVLLWPGSSSVNSLERERQMTNTQGSCWAFICHIYLSDKTFPTGRKGHLTGLPVSVHQTNPRIIYLDFIDDVHHLFWWREKKVH